MMKYLKLKIVYKQLIFVSLNNELIIKEALELITEECKVVQLDLLQTNHF